MIFTDRTIIVQKGTSSINDTIVLYRGDRDVEIRFTLNEGSPFKFGSGASPNIIEKTEAAYGQLIIKRPNDLPAVFSEIAPTNRGKIIFTITAEMINEITEVGNYTFQIRLLDESRNSRATIPEVVNGIEIREPIASEDATNKVGTAMVGYALTTAGTTEDAFDTQGNYNKTTWATGDRITAAKLDKIEAGIDGVNKKAASGGVASDISITDTANNFTSTNVEGALQEVHSQIKEKANKNEVFSMANMGQDIKEAMTGGSVAVVGKNTVLNENIVDGQVTYNKTDFLNIKRENHICSRFKFVTQNGSTFVDSDSLTNRIVCDIYLEPDTNYTLYSMSNLGTYLIQIYSDDAMVLQVAESTTLTRNGVKFNTSNIEKGFYKLLIRNINAWSDNSILNYDYFLLKSNSTNSFVDFKYSNSNLYSLDLDMNLDNFRNFIKVNNIVPKYWKENITLSEIGAEAPSSTQKTTFLIPALENMNYYVSHDIWMGFYDENGNIIGKRKVPQSSELKAGRAFIKSPVGTKYLRYSINNSVDDSDIICIPSRDKIPFSLNEANKPTLSYEFLPNPNVKLSRYDGKKLVTDGDSLVAMQRWQAYVTNNTGMTLLKNCGVGGSKVSQMCSDERVSEIPSDTEVLILLGGTNDFGQANNATPIGTIDDAHTNATFYGAYQLWLDKLIAKIPNALIVILIPPHRKDEYIPNHLGFYIEDYRIAIRDVAYKYGIPVADLRANMGANMQNIDLFLDDVVHINERVGGKKVGEIVVGKLLEIEPFYF